MSDTSSRHTSSRRGLSLNEQIEHVHWHLVRSDSQRAGVASRAGALLSTNAIVIAGIALTLGLKSDKPGLAVHGYRFTKLRVALRWLLAALCLFLIAVILSAIGA